MQLVSAVWIIIGTKLLLSQQKKALEIQAEWALEMNLPIVLHTRDSFYDTYKIIKPFAKKGLTGVFHCFSGSQEEANQLLSLDTFYMGIGGVLTYKNAGIAETVKKVPLDKIVLETDAPFLTPVPFRGKRNESAYIKIIAQKLADLKEISLNEIEFATTNNALSLFQMN
jgi:TatD DNase family protein